MQNLEDKSRKSLKQSCSEALNFTKNAAKGDYPDICQKLRNAANNGLTLDQKINNNHHFALQNYQNPEEIHFVNSLVLNEPHNDLMTLVNRIILKGASIRNNKQLIHVLYKNNKRLIIIKIDNLLAKAKLKDLNQIYNFISNKNK